MATFESTVGHRFWSLRILDEKRSGRPCPAILKRQTVSLPRGDTAAAG